MPTKKNGWHAPSCIDERMLYIEVECGQCYECRKKKRRNWMIRMFEELKENSTAVFFTGTFTDERIKQLRKRYAIDEEDVNAIATKEVRLFLERIRKENNGKSIKHWIITEKGHTNTRRIHIHGIFFTKELSKRRLEWILYNNWIAGYSYNGDYVNEKTINYVSKYMTKIDKDNPEFTGKVLCSPGLGKQWIQSVAAQSIHYVKKQYGKETIEYYRMKDGTKMALPKYYREKIFTEEERTKLWAEKLDDPVVYIMGEKFKAETDEDLNIINDIAIKYRKQNKTIHGDNPKAWDEKKRKRWVEQKRAYPRKVRELKEKDKKKEIYCPFGEEGFYGGGMFIENHFDGLWFNNPDDY